MGILDRILGVMFALALGSFGMFAFWVRWKEALSVDPLAIGVLMLMSALGIIVALFLLWFSLTPVRWHPKALR
jgi:hypothetical protein